MSMIHFLTIGFLAPAAISRRELRPRGVLNEELLALVRSFADVEHGRIVDVAELERPLR